MKSLIWMCVFMAAALIAQQPEPIKHPTAPSTVKPATPQPSAPIGVVKPALPPVITADMQADFFRTRLLLDNAQAAAEQAVKNASERRNDWLAAAKAASDVCGKDFQLSSDQQTAKLSCQVKSAPAAPPAAK